MSRPLHKQLGAIQKKMGCKLTLYQRHEINYSNVINKHLHLVQKELIHRGVTFINTIKIIECKKLLKQHDKKKQQDKYISKHDSPPKDEDLRLFMFKPIKREAKDWGDAYIDSGTVLLLP